MTFPLMVILTVGILCVWASQSMARGRSGSPEALELMSKIDLQTAQLEAQCDRSASLKNQDLTRFIEKEVGASCDRKGGHGCGSVRISFGHQNLSVIVKGPRLSCGAYPTELRATDGGPATVLSRQSVIETALGYPCQGLRHREEPARLYNECAGAASKDTSRESLNASDIREIEQARLLIFGPAQGSSGRAVSANVEKPSASSISAESPSVNPSRRVEAGTPN